MTNEEMSSDKMRLEQIIKRFDLELAVKDALERKATSVVTGWQVRWRL